MLKPKNKGYVGFNETPGKLVAEMADDEEMRNQTEELKAHDGYEGSCGVSSDQEKD